MKRDFLGQPLWLWGVGAAVVIGGFLYLRHKSGTAAAADSAGAAAQPEKSTSSFKEWITQHQGGTPAPKPKPKDTVGPERQWLIHKTGSQHPWTFLRQHHERIEVGPTGSRKIVKG